MTQIGFEWNFRNALNLVLGAFMILYMGKRLSNPRHYLLVPLILLIGLPLFPLLLAGSGIEELTIARGIK